MSGDKFIQFGIGPVQGFVARSRRTRDLLVSSFLLSYLAGVAMKRILEEEGGRILLPHVHGSENEIQDRLLAAITKNENPPIVGSLPNRFLAKTKPSFDPEECVRAVRDKWKRLADIVWKTVMTQEILALGRDTKKIWDRQVNGWWEIVWVEGDNPQNLNLRKFWRTHVPTVEPGDKCTMMNELQELSGWMRHHERKNQEKFWGAVRDRIVSEWPNSRVNQLGDTERLSAIGLIKRLLPLMEKKLGWEFPEKAKFFPSNTYLAALPWCRSVITTAERDQELKADLKTYLDALQEAEKSSEIKVTKHKQGERFFHPEDGVLRAFSQLDGHCYFEDGLTNLFGKDLPEELVKAYQKLTEKVGEPSAYYALLLMDGDRIGKLLQNKVLDLKQLSRALHGFTNGIEKTMEQNDGVTIYAGGDDVLAMVPLNKAVRLAAELRESYRQAFLEVLQDPEQMPTISAAVVFAHYMVPLSEVIRHAHMLLDDVAKDQTGRDSLAVGIWRRSGPDVTWSIPWDAFLLPDGKTLLDQLTDLLYREDDSGVSTSFLYKLRVDLGREPKFFSEDQENDDQENMEILQKIIAADYMRAKGQKGKQEREHAEKIADVVLRVCLTSVRHEDDKPVRREDGEPVQIETGKLPFRLDGALLAKFLAGDGRERE